MLSVYDGGQKYPVSNAMDFYITHVDGGLDTIDFKAPVDDPIYSHLAEENRVEYGDNDYNIKSIDAPSESANIHCEIDLDFLKSNFHRAYNSGSVTLSALLGSILPEGWEVAGYDPGISRTISMDNATDYDIVSQAQSTYSVVFQWRTLKKVVTVVNPADKTPSGEYLTDELNLRSIAFKGESTDFCTRLYPYGIDGMTIASVNDGKEYVENHQYSDKVICGYWSDERYTVPENLKADAEARLASLAVPARSYDCDVIDLEKLDSRYSMFGFAMYKVVTLIDRQRGIRLDHQIMEYKEYPDEPQKNVLTLSSVVPKIQNAVDEAITNANEASIKSDANAAEIELRVKKDGVISAINLSPESVKIQSGRLEITGFVMFSDLESEGQSTVNGKNITTGRIEGPNGRFYLDLDTGDSAVESIIDANGIRCIYISTSSNAIYMEREVSTTNDVYVGGDLYVHGHVYQD